MQTGTHPTSPSPPTFLILRGKYGFVTFMRACLCLPNVRGVTSLLKYYMLERPWIKQHWNDCPKSKCSEWQSWSRSSVSQATAAPTGFIVPSLLRTYMPGIVLEIQQKLDNSNLMTRRATCGINLLGKSVTKYVGRLKKKKKRCCVIVYDLFCYLKQSGLIVTALIEYPGKYFIRCFKRNVLKDLSMVLSLLLKSVMGIGFSALQWGVIIWD